MDAGSRLLADLHTRRTSPVRTALVVAHPDDETIALGGSLHLMPHLLLVHVTDGAPRHLDDARRAGFATPDAYAAAREAELCAALAQAGAAPIRVRLGIPDQDATDQAPAVADRLHALFDDHGIEAVVTHAYEGGHPDHDATACAARRAADRAAGGRPVLEFPVYRAGPDGTTLPQRFLPGLPETRIVLHPDEAEAKRAALACFATQAGVLAMFGVAVERLRRATPDFDQAPHPGRLNYEAWGWPPAQWRTLTAERWRTLTAERWRTLTAERWRVLTAERLHAPAAEPACAP